MIKRTQPDRRSAPTTGDRRRITKPLKTLDWGDSVPGAIRPLPGEHVQVERRRFPESGTE